MKHWLLAFVLFAACRPAAPPAAPQRPPEPPPPALAPHLARLEALAHGGPQPPAPTLVAQWREMAELAFGADSADRRLAVRAANALRDEPGARWALEDALGHADAAVRRGVLTLLGELGLQASLPPLLMRLKYEPDPQARLDVIAALTRLGNGAGLEELAASFARPDLAEAAGALAIDALRRAGTEPGENPTWDQLRTGIDALHDTWRRTGQVPPLAAGTAEPELLAARFATHLVALTGFQLRPVDDARFVLSRSGTLGLEMLRPCLLASEPFLRTHSLEIVRDLGVAASPLTDAVLPLLGDPLTRADAVRTLGRLRAVAVAPRLREWLAHENLEVRCAAAGALGPIGDRTALPTLRQFVDDPKAPMDLRVQAAFSLAILELDRPGYRFLLRQLDAGDYHEPTLRELLDAVDRWK